MRRSLAVFAAVVAVFVAGFLVGTKQAPVQAKEKPGTGFAAIPGEMNTQDVFGGYDAVADWPQNISTLPGNSGWTWGAGQSVYAESPNRIFLLFRGELPNIKRPATKLIPDFGPSLQFPIGRLPWRDATVSALPGAGGSGQDPADGPKLWKGTLGVDAKWEHCLTVVDGNGKIIETWTQWDKIMKRPHFVTINPYDPEKHVWVVDDHMHAIYKFTHDGKQAGADHRHANGERRRRHALQPADVHRLAAGQHHVRRRRL